MSIIKSLRTLTMAVGGDPNAKTISDCLDSIAATFNPLTTLKVEPVTPDIATAEELLGVDSRDMQEGLSIYNDRITGTLKYVTEFTGFSGNVEEQEGNYLALKVSVPDQTGVTITLNYTGVEKPLDADGLVILRVTKAKGFKVVFKASKSGHNTFSRTITFNNLTLLNKKRA